MVRRHNAGDHLRGREKRSRRKILITGHTDNVGQAADNLLLSNNRAKATIAYLQKNGIDIKRLSAKGFGTGKPIADNTTEAGRAMNRRTELSIISN